MDFFYHEKKQQQNEKRSKDVPLVEFVYLVLHAVQLRVTAGDSGLVVFVLHILSTN